MFSSLIIGLKYTVNWQTKLKPFFTAKFKLVKGFEQSTQGSKEFVQHHIYLGDFKILY